MNVVLSLLRRDSTDADFDNPGENITDPGTEEMYQSWALVIMLGLLIASLVASYYLQSKRIHSVHESVLSILAGMFVGLVVRVAPGHFIQERLSFSHSYFFNILLPPIILNSGYQLHQQRFFENSFSILTFAFVGTFLACVSLGILLWVWAAIGLEGINLPFVDAISVAATLSATDPVTILSIFNAQRVDQKLYTIIFGESLLNDAVCIVVFETAQKLRGEVMTFNALFRGIGIFLVTFTISLLIGVLVGVLTALMLKHTRVRRFPEIESCLVLLLAYFTYFFSNGCHMSGIVSLLFAGITLKHYAYYNMTRRTQMAIKYTFQILAQLSENFIFVYLGLTLFTNDELVFRPLLITVTAIGICLSRYVAVFPLSRLINKVYSLRSNYGSRDELNEFIVNEQEIPEQYQYMLFWAGLRGAVGVALAAGIEGPNAEDLRAAVLVVVVLTVLVFGGTTVRMLEILGIQTGVEEDQDSDDEFDLVAASRPRISVPPPTTRSARWFSELDANVIKPVLLES